MAISKTKGTSKKIKELKGIKPEKITDEQLEKDYGTFDVNIQDGTINYTKENGEVNKED